MNRRKDSETDLDPAVRALREVPAEVLSGDARERILHGALEARSTSEAPLAALFAPRRWLVAAAALPLLLAAALVALVDRSAISPTATGAPTRVEAMKVGGQVVFTIANGKTAHRVYRSTTPERFDLSAPVSVTDGVYRDGLDRGADVVFYRID
jgi:hypothetical protein